MFNQVILIGRMTKDAVLKRTTNEEGYIAEFTLAVDKGKEETSFIPCKVLMTELALNMDRYTTKGALLAVSGRIDQHSYTNKQGVYVNVVEVIVNKVMFLTKKSSNDDPKKEEEEPTEKKERVYNRTIKRK